jgi:hypothetical protein
MTVHNNSMGHHFYKKSSSQLEGQEISHLLWYPKFNYSIHKDPPLDTS